MKNGEIKSVHTYENQTPKFSFNEAFYKENFGCSSINFDISDPLFLSETKTGYNVGKTP